MDFSDMSFFFMSANIFIFKSHSSHLFPIRYHNAIRSPLSNLMNMYVTWNNSPCLVCQQNSSGCSRGWGISKWSKFVVGVRCVGVFAHLQGRHKSTESVMLIFSYLSQFFFYLSLLLFIYLFYFIFLVLNPVEIFWYILTLSVWVCSLLLYENYCYYSCIFRHRNTIRGSSRHIFELY